MNYFNKTANEIKYDNLFLLYLNEELCTTSKINKDGLIIKGKFMPRNIESIVRKFIEIYKKCTVCNSYNSFLIKNNRLLFKKCINCKAEICITK